MPHVPAAATKIKRHQVHGCSSEMQMLLWSSHLLATGKKSAQAFSALGQNWIWWQQQSRLCKVEQKEEPGII